MKKITKLRICDWSLLVVTVAILISGIQLEVTDCAGMVPVWIHIVIGLLFMAGIAYHIFLHFGKSDWFARFRMQKSQFTRILWWVWLLTLVSGIVACIHWSVTYAHSPIGGIHGKIGFIMVAMAVGHICKRIKFFKGQNRKKFITVARIQYLSKTGRLSFMKFG